MKRRFTVTKREVTGAGFRVEKPAQSTDEIVKATLHEQTIVDRFPMNRSVIDGLVPAPRQEGDVWIIPIVKEVLVTETRLMVVEEIRVTRRETMREHTQSFPLRSERLQVTPLDALDQQ